MRSCPTCGVDRDEDQFRRGKRSCIECLRAKGRERERLRRLRDGDHVRALDRARVRSPEQQAKQRERMRLLATTQRRAAGTPVRRKGSDPVKVEAQRLRNLAARRVPDELRKRQRYESPEARAVAAAEWRRKSRAGPAGVRERARHAERQRELRRADPEAVRAREREQARRWRLANPEAARRKGQRDSTARNARKRQADVRVVSQRDLDRLLVRQRGRCAYCDEPDPTTLDHVVPLVRGGRHAIGNLAWACEPCNKSKGARLLAEWRLRCPTGARGAWSAGKR